MGGDGKWKAFDKLFLLRPQGKDGRRIEKIHSHSIKGIGKESLVDWISVEVWLKGMDGHESAGEGALRKLQLEPRRKACSYE